jgi:alginate O-acetyltransferase complex protein AlgI
MVFSSVVFLFLFLPLVLGLYLISPRPARNSLLLLSSLLFYAWGEGFFVLLMLASIGMNYAFGLWIERARRTPRRHIAVGCAVAANLGLLAWFKYANFAVDSLNRLLGGDALGPLSLDPVHLPIGISFFTFQAITYVVDVAREDGAVERNPLHVALYISLFPQLIAGPIVRFQDIAREIHERRPRLADIASGVRRFTIGLGKKVLIANLTGRVADSIFAIPADQLTPGLAWLGAVSYMLQIYFDFSGYSDMAIGLGRILGFHFRENFEHPYVARSITEFWRRWHISLSTWFRDYLYIPLGGNRKGSARTGANLLAVFVLCGLWHGASWTFVLWGLYHGVFLIAERATRGRRPLPASALLGHAYTLAVVLGGWVLFRAESLPQAVAFWQAMAGFAGGDGVQYYAGMYIDPVFVLALLAGVVGATPWVSATARWLDRSLEASSVALQPVLGAGRDMAVIGILVAIFATSAMELSVSTHNPFIYFRF